MVLEFVKYVLGSVRYYRVYVENLECNRRYVDRLHCTYIAYVYKHSIVRMNNLVYNAYHLVLYLELV